ncbi:MAG: GNAT family N-acetyltransferase [Clostridia bacterium]|nr:GNAT family N-acetyltransferase [Clostridia bacterium]
MFICLLYYIIADNTSFITKIIKPFLCGVAIKYVYVDPNYRGRRISAMLISESAKSVDCPLSLNCRENNAPALKVYRSLGFETVSIHEKVQIPITHRGISTKKYRI